MCSSFHHRQVRVPNCLNQFCLLQRLTSHSIHCCVTALGPVNQVASDKLLADAAQEEGRDDNAASPEESEASKLTSQYQNWAGEESMQDAILRMLVDEYKPLRSGPIRSSDQKLKDFPPEVGQSSVSEVVSTRPWQDNADTPLLSGIEGHKPWHTTFKVPSHAIASIKVGNFVSSSTSPDEESDGTFEHTRRTEREIAKRKQQARRLSHAREVTLDYQLGLGVTCDGLSQSNPVSLKGWNSLIEDHIEKARLSGQFDKVRGRGQPIARPSEEHNPFIAREEILLNRIVQRHGAAPPWVAVQIELEAAVDAFRKTLRQSWSRRAIRMLTLSRRATRLSLSTAMALRDREWEERERSYHDIAIAELNSLVRKHNALAPYAVRRPYYTRDTELAKAYENCAEEIVRGVEQGSEDVVCSENKWMSVDDTVFSSIWARVLHWLRSWFTREQ